jgi:hypothetical protein
MQAASLLYHDVVPEGEPEVSGFSGVVANRYKLTRQAFANHLQAIRVQPSVRNATAQQVLSDETSTASSCLLTFDDGGVSALTEIAEQLEALDWRGHFFITTDYIGRPGFLSADQIRELHQRGHVIGAHSCSHPSRIDELDENSLLREWSHSAAVLTELLGTPTWCGSIPGGFFLRRVAMAARQAGLKLLFTSEPTCRWSRLGELRIAGRLPIVNHTTPSHAATLASGDRWSIFRQQCVWNGKKLAKTVAGNFYRDVSEWFFRKKQLA